MYEKIKKTVLSSNDHEINEQLNNLVPNDIKEPDPSSVPISSVISQLKSATINVCISKPITNFICFQCFFLKQFYVLFCKQNYLCIK